MPKLTPPTEAAIATARRLAINHPSSLLGCPICTASLKAENLDRHLSKVHADLQTNAGTTNAALQWRGVDNALWQIALAMLALYGAGMVIFLILRSSAQMSSIESLAFGGPALALFAFLCFALTPWVPASLRLEVDTLELRWGLGLLRRSTRLEGPVIAGVATIKRVSATQPNQANYNSQTETVRGGRYLEIGGIRVAAVGKGTAFGKHWSDQGVQTGKRHGRWHITIAREEMVALEYALAARDLLQLRERD